MLTIYESEKVRKKVHATYEVKGLVQGEEGDEVEREEEKRVDCMTDNGHCFGAILSRGDNHTCNKGCHVPYNTVTPKKVST